MDKYELRDDEYRGEKDLPYCKKCRTPRACRFDDNRVYRHLCKCEAAQRDFEEEQRKLAQRRQRVEALKANSMLGKHFEHCTFEKSVASESNNEIIKLCKAYCEKSFEMLKEGYGIYLYGAPGVGKTHLTACMGNALTEKLHTVLFTSFLEINNKLKANFGNNHEQDKLLQLTESVDFLFLDDLGTEPLKADSNSWLQSIVFDITNSRYNAKKPVICSSNYKRSELITQGNYGERTIQRLMEICSLTYELNGDSFRNTLAEQRRTNMLKAITSQGGK